MPAISLPYQNQGHAIVLTDACTVLTANGMYGHAAGHMNNDTLEQLTVQEFQAINWNRILSVRHINGSYPILYLRISIYGMDLSERATGIARIMMRKFEFRHSIRSMFFFNARISWLACYEQLKERRTAVAMANHRRLGSESILNSIGNDLLAVVNKFI